MGRINKKQKTEQRCKKFFYPLIMTVIILITAVNITYGGSKITDTEGETGFVIIKEIEKNYLTTDDGQFLVSEKTKIYNQDAVEISYSDIKKAAKASIIFQRIGGELVALEIIAKFEQKKLPE
ncbi:MAG: hypothetical protein JW944_14665 [Deltaproteobacteria bacterium]|nr:hypothetical protein [Deltaproteobacteria bacterium]